MCANDGATVDRPSASIARQWGPFWEGIGKVVGPASPMYLQCYPSSLADRSHGEVSDYNVNPACLQYGRSGGSGLRARFRTWFPFREWRFESSLRHCCTRNGLRCRGVNPFLFPSVPRPPRGNRVGIAWCPAVALRAEGERGHTLTRDGKSWRVRVASDCEHSSCNSGTICQLGGGRGASGHDPAPQRNRRTLLGIAWPPPGEGRAGSPRSFRCRPRRASRPS